jgi:hypothetical protein
MRRLYIAVAGAAVVPIWSVRYLPTIDGPSHLYNSWILYSLLRGAKGPIADWFQINWRPYPNWIGHAAMSLLMFVVTPIVAEKLFVTGVVLLFLYAMWRYAAPSPFVFLAVPFAYSLMLQNGFYNFCTGAALYFLIVAVWWRRRDRPGAATISFIAALLLLCYFSHALPAILSMASIGLLWLLTLRGRRFRTHALHFIALLPILPLLIWFGPTGGSYLQGEVKHGELLRFLARLRILYAFDHRQLAYATAIAILLAALILGTFIRRQWRWTERDAFIILWLALVALYLLSGSVVADVQDRMALFVALAPLAWLDLRLPRRATAAAGAVLAVLALAYCGYLVERFRFTGRYVTQLVRSAEAIGHRSTFLPLLYEIMPPDTVTPVYSHAIDYAALKSESVDITNYEAVLGYFPIRPRPGVTLIGDPWELRIPDFPARAQYLFVWRGDADPALPAKLAPFYARVGGSGSGAVYRAIRAERILLPLLGTRIDHGAPGGMTWRVEQRVSNGGESPVTLLLTPCERGACTIDLPPGGSAPIASSLPYAFASVRPQSAEQLQFTTVLQRVDVPGAVSIPAVRERDFRDGRLIIDGVPFRDPYRVALRVWMIAGSAAPVVVALRDPSGRTLAAKQLNPDANGAVALTNLVYDFGNVAQRREPVNVAVEAGRARVWGFVSAIDPNVPTPALHFPR